MSAGDSFVPAISYIFALCVCGYFALGFHSNPWLLSWIPVLLDRDLDHGSFGSVGADCSVGSWLVEILIDFVELIIVYCLFQCSLVRSALRV